MWQLDVPADYAVDRNWSKSAALEKLVEEHGAILDVGGEGRFDLRFVRDESRVRFQARRAPHTLRNWVVEELGREALPPLEPTPWYRSMPPTLELPHAGTHPLQLSGQPQVAHADIEIGPRQVTPAGEIRLEDFHTDTVFVWSEHGELLSVGRERHAVPWTDRKQVGAWSFARKQATELVFQHEGAGEPRLLERRPDGRWIRQIQDIAVAPDGTLYALDLPSFLMETVSPLLVYDREGRPLDVLPHEPVHFVGSRLRVTDRWVLSLGESRNVYLIRRSDGAAFRFVVPFGEGSREWTHGVSQDGQTLMSVDVENLVVHHFALP